MNSWTTGWILSGLSHFSCLYANFRYWVPFSFFKSDHLFSATSPYSFTSITYISEGSVAYFTIKPIWSSKCYYLVESLTIITLWVISYPSPVHTVTVEQHNIKSISFHEKLALSDCWLLFPKLSSWCRQLMNETLRGMDMWMPASFYFSAQKRKIASLPCGRVGTVPSVAIARAWAGVLAGPACP